MKIIKNSRNRIIQITILDSKQILLYLFFIFSVERLKISTIIQIANNFHPFSVPASVLEFRPTASRNVLSGGELLVPVHDPHDPGMVSGPGEALRVRTTRQTPHARATLAATTQGSSPTRKKPLGYTFTDAVRGAQHPVIEGRPHPVTVSIIKNACTIDSPR